MFLCQSATVYSKQELCPGQLIELCPGQLSKAFNCGGKSWSGRYMPLADTLRFIERWEFLQDGQHEAPIWQGHMCAQIKNAQNQQLS